MAQEEPVDVFDPSGQVARSLVQEARAARLFKRFSWERSYRAFDTNTEIRALAAQARSVRARAQRSEASCDSCGIAGWQSPPTSTSESESAARFGSPAGWERTEDMFSGNEALESQSRTAGTVALDPIDRTSQGSSALLEFLSPYLGPVTEALEPLLSAHGLSAANATTADVLAIEGLVEEILVVARQVVAQIDAVDSLVNHPLTGGELSENVSSAELPDEPLSEIDPLEGGTIPGWDAAMPPPWAAGRMAGGEVSGWEFEANQSTHAFAYDAVDQDPCYPNIPGLEEYFPKCPQPTETKETPCKEDERFLRADERLREHKGFFEIPNNFRGFPYRDYLKQSVQLPIEELYTCVEDDDLASWTDIGKIIEISANRFLDLNLSEEILSVLSRGRPRFRAGVLLHEHVHRIEDRRVGVVPPPDERSYKPLGSPGQETCKTSGTEYDGAYIQALYSGASVGFAKMYADIYSRSQCSEISPSAKLFAAVGDVLEWLSLDWLKSSIVVAAFTGSLFVAPTAGIAILAAFIPKQLLALLLLILLPGPSDYP